MVRVRSAAAFAGVLIMLAVLNLPVAGHCQGNLAIEVTPTADIAVIGQDLVLDITLTLPPGATIPADDLDIKIEIDGNHNLLESPYPLRLLDPADTGIAGTLLQGTFSIEWAAPLVPNATPGTYVLRCQAQVRSATAEPLDAMWVGDIQIDFGEEWSADKITAFIQDKGMVLFLLVVFGFGILMSFSPCIYPMIPITLAVIGAQSQEKGAAHGLVMSVTYVIGMALVYAVMGALSATVFSGITAFMQSPAVLVPIALLLLILAFGMFGAFELEAPRFLRDRLQGPGGSNRTGLIAVFAMGLVAGLVASPCVGPFLAALLVWVATTGDWLLGFFCLFTFGIGMGLLLIGVGTFPAMLGSMPRSGGWMETVKKSMGLLLVVMAFYFVRPGLVLPEKTFFILAGLAAVLVGVFMGAFDALAAGTNWWHRTRKGLGLVVFVLGLYVLLGTFWQHRLLLPEPPPTPGLVASPGPVAPPTAAVQIPLPEKVQWQIIHTGEEVETFLADQRRLAREAGKPVMIDFWATWCKLCLVLDKQVWNDPAVVAEAQRFVTLKIDATDQDEEMNAIFDEYKVAGMPTVVFIDSRGEVLLGRSTAFKKAGPMLEVMQGIR